MRVRVWISGADGPVHDFELPAAPHVGETISVAIGRAAEEGVVQSVSWHLQGIERAGDDISIDGEPVGSVTVVHVICRPPTEHPAEAYGEAAVQTGAEARPPEPAAARAK